MYTEGGQGRVSLHVCLSNESSAKQAQAVPVPSYSLKRQLIGLGGNHQQTCRGARVHNDGHLGNKCPLHMISWWSASDDSLTCAVLKMHANSSGYLAIHKLIADHGIPPTL